MVFIYSTQFFYCFLLAIEVYRFLQRKQLLWLSLKHLRCIYYINRVVVFNGLCLDTTGLASVFSERIDISSSTSCRDLRGCGASLNSHARYARSLGGRKMSIKFSLWRIQITVKLSLQRSSRRKKSNQLALVRHQPRNIKPSIIFLMS